MAMEFTMVNKKALRVGWRRDGRAVKRKWLVISHLLFCISARRIWQDLLTLNFLQI